MTSTIKLTAPNGTAVHVVKANVFSVIPAVGQHPQANAVVLSVGHGDVFQAVQETPEQVLAMMGEER